MKKGLIILLVYILLCTAFAYEVLLKKEQRSFSVIENRNLETKETAFENIDSNLINNVNKLAQDQFPLRDTLLKTDLAMEKSWANVVATVYPKSENLLIRTGEVYCIGNSGYYTYGPVRLSEETEKLLGYSIYNLNAFANFYGDKYHYYIYKPTVANEMPQASKDGENIWEFFVNNMNGYFKCRRMEFADYNEYKEYFYKTDHHWDMNGSYRGYREIIDMIREDIPEIGVAKEVDEEIHYDYPFYGSLSLHAGGLYGYDEFVYFKLKDESKLITEIDGEEKEYGLKEKCMTGNPLEHYVYEEYFGENDALVHFHNTNCNNGKSLLVFGDSFSNSVNAYLANNFEDTYIIDLRSWMPDETHPNNTFDVKSFLETHDVDAILWLQFYTSLYFDARMYLSLE